MFINFVMLGLAWVSVGLPWLWFADLLLNFYGIWKIFSLYFLKLLPCLFTSQTTAAQRHLKHTTDLKLSSGEILTTEAHVAFSLPLLSCILTLHGEQLQEFCVRAGWMEPDFLAVLWSGGEPWEVRSSAGMVAVAFFFIFWYFMLTRFHGGKLSWHSSCSTKWANFFLPASFSNMSNIIPFWCQSTFKIFLNTFPSSHIFKIPVLFDLVSYVQEY